MLILLPGFHRCMDLMVFLIRPFTDFRNKLFPFVKHTLESKTLDNFRCMSSESISLVWFAHQRVHRSSKGRYVLFREENTIHSISDDFGRTGWTIKANDRKPACHRLAESIRKALEARRQNEQTALR